MMQNIVLMTVGNFKTFWNSHHRFLSLALTYEGLPGFPAGRLT